MPVVGARVAVPFSGRSLVGVVMALNPADAHAFGEAGSSRRWTEQSVLGTDEIFELGRWLAGYYQHPIRRGTGDSDAGGGA